MPRLTLVLAPFLVLLACDPGSSETSDGDGETSDTTQVSTSDPSPTSDSSEDTTEGSGGSGGSGGDTSDTSSDAGSSTGSTGDPDASTGGTPTGGRGACECAPASPEFCGAAVDLCKSVGLNFPHPDFCAAYAKWCAEGTSGDTCSTCTFLQSTCDDFAPEPASCAGLYDACSCLS